MMFTCTLELLSCLYILSQGTDDVHRYTRATVMFVDPQPGQLGCLGIHPASAGVMQELC